MPGAKVEIRHVATGTITTVSTNREASCTAPNLPLGDYTVLITKDGFTPATAEGLNLRSGVQTRVDRTLSPVGVTETISVAATNLDSSAISNTTALPEKLITDLPVIVGANKRDITGFLTNLPGFTSGTTFNARANGANVGKSEVFVDVAAAGR